MDAALDLSHTENIGAMLKSHFSHSQFIVVSLKEGMFNNANVIFTTKFVDGISAVHRAVVGGAHSSKSAPHKAPKALTAAGSANAAAKGSRKRTKTSAAAASMDAENEAV